MTNVFEFEEIANKIVQSYCEQFGISQEDLHRKERKKYPVKKRNGVSYSKIRQALTYYLYENLPLHLTQIGPIVGYQDHSTASTYIPRIKWFIQHNDAVFMKYWELLNEVAKPHTPDLDFSRSQSAFIYNKLKKWQSASRIL
jgi:chromosomal replication initiation ATPase DnaA